MATLIRNITKGINPLGKAELLLRLSVSRNLVVSLKTGLWIDPSRLDKGTFSLPKDPAARAEIRAIEDRLIDIERFLINLCEKKSSDTLTKDFVGSQYDLFLHPKPEKKKRQPREPNFFDIFEDYIEKKNIFTTCGIVRMVTVLNPITGAEEKRPLNEIGSSHLARRTFIGNLYKKVKDPNLVGSLSGHKEGSKAFARYRDIDEDMKKELVNLLD